MSDDLSHRLSSIADEMERAARGKSVEDLHELFAEASRAMREASAALDLGAVKVGSLRPSSDYLVEVYDGTEWIPFDDERGVKIIMGMAEG